MASLMPYVLVASGGALGALARFVLSRWVGALVETRFPMGTFVINVSGSRRETMPAAANGASHA